MPQSVSCHGCQRLLLPAEELLCRACQKDLLSCRIPKRQRLQLLDKDRIRAYSSCWHQQIARELVLGLKYRHDVAAASLLAAELSTVYNENELSEPHMVTAVPTHPSRIKERGYNQAQLLAERFCEMNHLPLDIELLRRTSFEDSQVHRDKTERYRAMENAFQALRPLRGERILLIDDVLTTGATVTSCVRELMKSGAEEVTVLTVCRA